MILNNILINHFINSSLLVFLLENKIKEYFNTKLIIIVIITIIIIKFIIKFLNFY